MKPGQKLGHQEPCWCGSRRKYKNCHYAADRRDWEIGRTHLSLQQRNLALIDAVRQIFGVKSVSDLGNVKRSMSSNQVKELYDFVERLWPRETNLSEVLPEENDQELRAFYLGDILPDLISRNLTRFGLYADRIFMIDPFIRTELFGSEFDPLKEPDAFKADTLKLVNFLLVVEPLVRAEIVSLIPHPGLFDRALQTKALELAQVRLSKQVLKKEDYEEFLPHFATEYARVLAQFPVGAAAELLKQDFPTLTDADLTEILTLAEQQRKDDPLVVDQEPGPSGATVWAIRSGANLEMALYVSQITGAFPFTNIRSKWNELLSAADDLSETARIWSPLTRAFQSLEFKFLDRVDPKFLHRLRAEDDRLGSFRSFLRDIWKEVGGEPDPSKISNITRDFVDRLKMEKSKMEAEWQKIDQDLLKWVGISGGLGSLAPCILTGELSLSFSGAGLIVPSVIQLIVSYSKRKSFRKTQPMSIFMDLSRHKFS